jgi:hypothetical protein
MKDKEHQNSTKGRLKNSKIRSKNSSCSTSPSNFTLFVFVNIDFASHALAKSKCSKHPTLRS